MNGKSEETRHNLTLEDRRRLLVSGVKKVVSFEAKEIILETAEGNLKIKGNELSVKDVDLALTKVEIEGSIDALSYGSGKGELGSKKIWEKVFK